MKTITINGWGQVFNSLDIAAPTGKIININYSKYANFSALVDNLDTQECDILIGWSLGGQIAMRLIEKGVIKPKLLVLIAAPYQFVSGKDFKDGMHPYVFQTFKNSFAILPGATLHRFAIMIAENDSKMKNVISKLGIDKENKNNWLHWLAEIENFSGSDLDFDKMPKTLILHGRNDTIINVRQGVALNNKIKASRLEIFEDCGHAPHFHDLAKVKRLIEECRTKKQ